MGVLYDVLFKPIGRGDCSNPAATATDGGRGDCSNPVATATGGGDCSSPVAAATDGGGDQSVPPEWVLDKRDGGGPLVWRRHGLPPTHRKRVEFLYAVDVHVFERDDCGDAAGHRHDDEDEDDEDEDNEDEDEDDGQRFWTDDWSWDDEDDGRGSIKTALFYRPPDGNDYPLLFAVSLTVLGACVALAYLFAPVKWLFHQLIVD